MKEFGDKATARILRGREERKRVAAKMDYLNGHIDELLAGTQFSKKHLSRRDRDLLHLLDDSWVGYVVWFCKCAHCGSRTSLQGAFTVSMKKMREGNASRILEHLRKHVQGADKWLSRKRKEVELVELTKEETKTMFNFSKPEMRAHQQGCEKCAHLFSKKGTTTDVT